MEWLSTSCTATGASSTRYGTPGVIVGNISCNNSATKHLLPSFASATISTPPKVLSRQRERLHQVKLRDHSCRSRRRRRIPAIRAEAETPMATEKSGIKIINNPPESKLSELGVRTWPKWGCPPSKFPWTYSSKETCYLLKGKVKVFPDGSDETVEIGAGDLVEFPKGMSCTWDVSEAVDKHYKFD